MSPFGSWLLASVGSWLMVTVGSWLMVTVGSWLMVTVGSWLITGCIRYSSSTSVTKNFRKKVNMFPTTLFLNLSAKKKSTNHF